MTVELILLCFTELPSVEALVPVLDDDAANNGKPCERSLFVSAPSLSPLCTDVVVDGTGDWTEVVGLDPRR